MNNQHNPLRCMCLVAATMAMIACNSVSAKEVFKFGRFGEAAIYKPVMVQHVAILFSDDHGFTASNDALAEALKERGVLAAAVDLRHYAAELAEPRDKCSYLAGEFEDFSHELQKQFSPQRYHLPVLIGVGRAAGLVYGVTAQGSSGTFVGALTLGFERQWLPLVKLCQSYELRYQLNNDGSVLFNTDSPLSTPWVALPASAQREPALAGVDKLSQLDQDVKAVSDRLPDLPLEEVRASGPATGRMALFLTGDGGWAAIDKGVSAQLAKRGVDVVALNSLQYFWKTRSPDETAKDVARVLRQYFTQWNKREVLVIGYSFGADVAPFVVNRLPEDLRNKVISVSLLGLAATADFEVHVTTWLGADHDGLQTRPEVERLKLPVLCLYGEGENDSLCPALAGTRVKVAKVGDGHHFGDRYAELAERILSSESP